MLNRPTEPSPLLRLGHYCILDGKLLGKGPNSLVYEGINIISGEHVCIKNINFTDKIQHELALNELSCLKQVQHPHVLRYLYDFQTRNSIYIVTELCEETLFAQLKRLGRFKQKEAIEIFLKILNGYEEIRKKGYLHRDLKPQNIFLKKGQLKIGDFGFCTQTKSFEVKEKYNVGTPLYMAPEVIQGNIYSQKSDIWSLGILLYEMLHGKVPFSSKREKDLIQEFKSSNIKFDCHPELQRILRSTLSRKKENRVALKDLQFSINKYLSEEPELQQVQEITLVGRKIANQIEYVNFMQYIKLISSKCKDNKKYSRINYIFQFCIKMRISLIQKLESTSVDQEIVLKKEVSQLKEKHQQALQLPQSLDQKDHLRFLAPNETTFNYFTLWHIQAELKDALKQILRDLVKIDTEEKVAKREGQLRLADFLLTAYVLNRILIESESCAQEFSQKFQLSLLLKRPHRFNMEVCRAIKLKGQELRII